MWVYLVFSCAFRWSVAFMLLYCVWPIIKHPFYYRKIIIIEHIWLSTSLQGLSLPLGTLGWSTVHCSQACRTLDILTSVCCTWRTSDKCIWYSAVLFLCCIHTLVLQVPNCKASLPSYGLIIIEDWHGRWRSCSVAPIGNDSSVLVHTMTATQSLSITLYCHSGDVREQVAYKITWPLWSTVSTRSDATLD